MPHVAAFALANPDVRGLLVSAIVRARAPNQRILSHTRWFAGIVVVPISELVPLEVELSEV